MISSTAFAILLTPQQFWMPLATGLMPYIFVSNIIGCFMLNYLIRGEVSFAEAVDVSRKHASTDHLTGLLNRRGFDHAYAWMTRGKLEKNHGLSILFFDIDFFKDINGTYGHAVGDAMLRHIADTVRENLRPLDIFARLGGDEFAVVLQNIDARTAKVIAQRCCISIAAGGFTHEGNRISVSASIGGVWALIRSGWIASWMKLIRHFMSQKRRAATRLCSDQVLEMPPRTRVSHSPRDKGTDGPL